MVIWHETCDNLLPALRGLTLSDWQQGSFICTIPQTEQVFVTRCAALARMGNSLVGLQGGMGVMTDCTRNGHSTLELHLVPSVKDSFCLG